MSTRTGGIPVTTMAITWRRFDSGWAEKALLPRATGVPGCTPTTNSTMRLDFRLGLMDVSIMGHRRYIYAPLLVACVSFVMNGRRRHRRSRACLFLLLVHSRWNPLWYHRISPLRLKRRTTEIA